MRSLIYDTRLYKLLLANSFSSIGSGITSIALPWLIVTKDGGDVLLGYITLFSTILMVFITPFIGYLIDQYSRKKVLIFGELLGFLVIIIFVTIGFWGVEYETWHLSILFISGAFYYNLFYPTMFAFNQEIFNKSQYKALNGIMEVQGQLTAVVSGALAAFLLPLIDLKWLLLIDAASYFIAASLFLTIPYKRMVQGPIDSETFWVKLTEGYRYIKQYPRLFLFLCASFMPFIAIMVTNYVFPVYIDNLLNADVSVYGYKSMVYGVGAVLAGLILPTLLVKIGNERVVVWTTLIFTISIVMFIFFPYVLIFYILTMFIAFGNAGTRVARNSLMMDMIPQEKMGRVDSLFRVIGLSIRIVLLTTFTQIIANEKMIVSFYILSGMLIVSLIIILLTLLTLERRNRKGANLVLERSLM